MMTAGEVSFAGISTLTNLVFRLVLNVNRTYFSSTLSSYMDGLYCRLRLGTFMGYAFLKSERCPMPDRPMAVMTVIGLGAPLFSTRVFASKLLLVGAILAPGQRTVTAVLRVLGKSAAAHCQHSHRVLNRAPWSALDARRRLLQLLLDVFVPQGPVVMGIDATIERRRGERIAAKEG
jgi:hypothetical protein